MRPALGWWLGWVVAVDDIRPFETARPRVGQGNRHRPDGIELLWKQLGVKGLQADPQLPFFIEWDIEEGNHPSAGATGQVSLECLEIAGDPPASRSGSASRWTGARGREGRVGRADGTPGIVAAQFQTPNGLVRI